MKWLLPLLLAGATCAASSRAQTNLAANGDFETGLAPWYGQKLAGDGSAVLPAPEMLSHETADTANGSAGALRVTIAKDPQYRYYSHNSGAICRLNQVVPAGTTVQVTFAAKSLSGGTRVCVSRLWGGGAARTAIGAGWQEYRVYVPLGYDTDALVFSLVPSPTGDIQTLEDGVFLLDDVRVVVTAPQPSLLFCSPQGVAWGWIDLDYLKELHAQGYEVDYTDSLNDVTWDRIRKYNALVLYVTPETWHLQHSGPVPPAGRNEEFLNLIEQYLDQGGGVFLFPREHGVTKQALYDCTSRWGARLPVETIVENDDGKRANLDHASYPVPLAWTDAVLPSPVSAGVGQLWYPTSPAYNAGHSGPIELDSNWVIVARASATAQSQPINLSSTGFDPPQDAYQRPGGVAAPPLMAIRAYRNGRVALLNQWPQYTIGSGVKWIFNRQVLSRGAAGRPSDWGRLLQNTFDWLCAPSLQGGAVGGFFTPAERLLAPNDQPSVVQQFQYNATWEQLQAQWNAPPTYPTVYRGLIGAKTTYSSGTSTVQQYAQAAKSAGLKFVVFLDDFDKLTPAKFEQLKADCRAWSDSQISLIPGFTIDANTGDRMFFFGPDGPWPPANVLTGPGNTLYNLQPQDASGNYTGYNGDSFNWTFNYHGQAGNIGYYHFSSRPGSQRIEDLRLYGMAAVRYYRDGVLIEDRTTNYLACAQGTIPPIPVSFNEVRSAAALTAEATSTRHLTYVRANSVATIFRDGLWWPHQYITFDTFLSNGPLIHKWAETVRHYTLGAEEFVTIPGVMASRLEVSAPNGLKEIAIYNGRGLFRRIALGGQKQYSTTLMLGKSVQKNLVLVVTDTKGRQAVGFARRCWKDGGREVVFCSDHVNDCKSGGLLLAHGPVPMLAHWVVPLPDDIAGYTWDGGPPATLPLVWFQESRPLLDSSLGQENAARFNQTPLLEFTDEGASAVSSEQNLLFDPRVLNVVNPWHTFGPLGGPSKLFAATLRYREYLSPVVDVPQVGWAGYGVRQGINASLFRSEVTFKSNLTVNSLLLLRNYSSPRLSPVYFAHGTAPQQVSQILNLSSGNVNHTVTLQPGHWFALFSGGTSASHVFLVRLQPVRVQVTSPVYITVSADMAGQAVSAGATRVWELASLGIPIDVTVTNIAGVTNRLAYLADPEGLQVLRGTRVSSPGLLEVAPSNHAVEVLVPAPSVPNDLTLPLRVTGLNRRWTAGLWQKQGYVKGDYGSGENRYRELGLDVHGNAYVPLHVNLATQTRVVAGHPVVASGAGTNLFIQVTHLYDNPHRWHVSVNNPTTSRITTTLQQAISLPGLNFPTTKLTLRAGEYRVLVSQ